MTKRALLLLLAACTATAQTVNTSQQITLQGLRTFANHGSFTAAAYATDGSLILLYDQHDGIRLLKTNAAANTLLAQSQQGATGDSGLALALDPTGNIYITGTSTSTTLTGTSGTAYPSRYDTTTNSFVAKYDANLNPLWLTFLGAGATSATSITATTSGPIITGLTYSQSFPVTPSAIQQTPAPNYNQNGFVESFTSTGAITYATYLNGSNGSTTPASIAADASGNAYITGSTTASGFPTINALVPNILTNPSGFLAALNPTGSAFLYSTFLPGNGLNSIAFDAAAQSLLLTGNIAPGQFPIDTVSTPLVSTEYQSLLRLTLNGQSITSATLLVPGTQSFVTSGPNATAWITGTLTTPLFPGDTAPDYASGDSFLLHLNANNTIDQTLRFGGLPISNAPYSSLTTTTAAPAINGASIALPGTLTAATASSLLSTQRFGIPFVQAPNTILSNTITDTLPTTTTCPNSSQCSGTAALLALIDTATSAPSLSLSANDLPNITLRNLGSATATGLNITATGYTLASNCTTTLDPSNACTIALTGTGPGNITATASNATTNTLSLPANTLTANPIAISTNELDFGIVTSTSPAITRTLTLTNLTATPQTFTSAIERGSSSLFTETATTCGSLTAHTIAANGTCTITLALTASTTADAAASAYWLVAQRDIKLTGFSQVAALNLSSTEIDFGTQYSGATSLFLPRYLYLSNNAATPITHNPVTLPATSPFAVTDNCPTTLEPHSVCSLKLTYNNLTAPSDDSITLTLDNNLSVPVTGQTLAPTAVTGSATNPSLTVSATAITFATPVTVTGISATQQSITLTNSGSIPFALAATITGDFQLTNPCPTTLNANASCQLFLNFAPSQPGQRDGLLSLTAGSTFSPTLITLTGTASAILPANNGVIDLDETYAGEPTQIFLPIQQSLPSLTAATNSPLFHIALIPNTGTAPTTLPPTSFTSTATAPCTSCYLGIQFLSQTSGAQSATLTLSTQANGNPYQLALTANALPVQGLLLTPITQDFGPVAVHSTSPALTFTFANLLPTSSEVTITNIATTGDFAITTNNTGGQSCTGTLVPTTSCYVQLLFAPTAEGNLTGTLTLTTSNGAITSTLTGYGAPDPGLSLSPNALNFNLAPNTTAGTQAITLTNTGTATLNLAPPTTTTTSFSSTTNCTTLTPSQTCTITVNFTPTTANITDKLSIPITATENGQSTITTYTVPLTGNYTTQDSGLQILPTQVNFGATTTGTLGSTREFTLNNLTARQLAIALTMPRQFPLADASTCATLAPNASCTFTVSFLPATSGALTGTVFAQGTPTDNSASAQSLAYMQGYGSGSSALTITGFPIPNNPVTFSTLTSGQTAQETLTLTNSGGTPLNIHRITSNPPFLSTTNCGISLAPSTSCTITITYAPIDELPATAIILTPRNDIGQLILESDATTSPDTLKLSGSVAPVLSSSPATSASLATYSLTQQALTFANTAVGDASTTQTTTLTNTGTTILHIASAVASTDFTATTTCATLAPGNTCAIAVQFTPTTASTNTVRSGTVAISSDDATSLDFLSLLATSSPAPLTLLPTALDFGTLNVATSTTLRVNITNTTAAPITFLNLSATGDYAATPNTCPTNGATLAANATCTLNVTFAPTTTGTRTGILSLTTDATTLPLTVTLTGLAVSGSLQITSSAIDFGNISIASPAPRILTIKNNGTATVTNLAANITGANAADFTLTSPCSTTSLAPNQSCTATITFTPSALGARVATLSITSSDPNSPTLIPLTGTGIASTNGGFTLTVNNASSQTITVASGAPATYALTLTPLNAFTGNVALTCAPIAPAQYASCSLLSSTLALAGLQQFSTATINTITTNAHTTTINKTLAWLFGPLTLLASRRRRQRRMSALILVLTCIMILTLSGCGSGHGGSSSTKILYTPAGTYQYQITASSTSGPTVTSTVTLNLIVQ